MFVNYERVPTNLPSCVASLSILGVIIEDAIVSIGGAIKSAEGISVGELNSVDGIFKSFGGDMCEARILLWESTMKHMVRIKIYAIEVNCNSFSKYL